MSEPGRTRSNLSASEAETVDQDRAPSERRRRSLLERPAVLYSLIGGIGLIVTLAIALAQGLATPFISGSDSSQYASIAASVAHGGGYRNPVGVWKTQPAIDRLPLWPLILSIGMSLAPDARDEVVSRLTALVFLALSGIAMGALCRQLGVRPWLCLLSGLYVSLSPILLYFALSGMSEMPFMLFVSAGLALALASPRYLYPAAFLIGLGSLIRANFIIVPLLFTGLMLLVPSTRPVSLSLPAIRRVVLALCLAYLPTGVWLARNYALTGRFPLLSSLYGENLYGSNNDSVAHSLEYWGEWILPDYVEGETSKQELAKRLPNDAALNDYYTKRGMHWIKTHVPQLPRLVLGKLVRACIPVPWSDSPSWEEFVAFGSRLVLQVLILLTIPFWWDAMDRRYLLFLAALGVAHLITTVWLHAEMRYTFCFFEVFAIPCAALGVDRWLQRRAAAANPRLAGNSYLRKSAEVSG